jgi:signal peptidase II
MLALAVAIVVAVADQWTKEWIRASFGLHEIQPVIDGFFNLTYVRNTGAAWGMFGGANAWLTLFSAAMLVVMVVFRRSFLRDTLSHRLALGLLAGGILGNLFDRVRLGYVTDFLDFRFGSYAFPSFNVADSGITIGVTIYIVSSFLEEMKAASARRDAAKAAPAEARSDEPGSGDRP